MTPGNQKLISEYLEYAKNYLGYTIDREPDEDFIPELAGMAERLGVLLSGIKAGFYTTTSGTSGNGMPPAKGIRLTATTYGLDEYNSTGKTNYYIVGNWECTACNKNLEVGDVVDRLTGYLKHIDCNKPQG